MGWRAGKNAYFFYKHDKQNDDGFAYFCIILFPFKMPPITDIHFP